MQAHQTQKSMCYYKAESTKPIVVHRSSLISLKQNYKISDQRHYNAWTLQGSFLYVFFHTVVVKRVLSLESFQITSQFFQNIQCTLSPPTTRRLASKAPWRSLLCAKQRGACRAGLRGQLAVICNGWKTIGINENIPASKVCQKNVALVAKEKQMPGSLKSLLLFWMISKYYWIVLLLLTCNLQCISVFLSLESQKTATENKQIRLESCARVCSCVFACAAHVCLFICVNQAVGLFVCVPSLPWGATPPHHQ